ncbi:hypothetical protein Sme01_18300 [Sphaerisporangium melleum]|uniref:Type I restriction modification DNA specificity domain-containing protein n=1 Tax=Sphaerisporangium melleum TaxID=321316 RepID=A0A917RM58_9ACTN|nr:hypothetical protein GCM10007964_65660 [Sphaerisporangium melleum]GII69354.1 hypothetical protein Sme01_18300 [Sphaerisporangium melleum]
METVIGPVPDSWRQLPFGEVANIQAGPANIKSDLLPLGEAGVPVLTPSEISWFRVTREAARSVSPQAAKRLQRYRVRAGDLVCVRTGDLGRAALVGPENDGWVLGTSCLRLRLVNSVNSGYVLQYLRHPQVRAWIKGNAKFSTIPSLSTQVLGDLPFVAAPLSVQSAVSDILGALEEKIAAHSQLIRECERLHEWLLPRLVSGELLEGGSSVIRDETS